MSRADYYGAEIDKYTEYLLILHRVSTVANALRLHRSYQGFESLTRYHFAYEGGPLVVTTYFITSNF